MMTRRLHELDVEVRRDARRSRTLTLAGKLNYYTAGEFSAAYRSLVAADGPFLQRVVIDLRLVSDFDTTGMAALLAVAKDAEGKEFHFAIADRRNRPSYVATGLHNRVKFLTCTDA